MEDVKRILELIDNGEKSPSKIAQQLINEKILFKTLNAARKQVEKAINNQALIRECIENGIDYHKVKHHWRKTKEFSVFVKEVEDEFIPQDFIEELKQNLLTMAPTYRPFVREVIKDPHCLLFDPADIHIGKICDSFETGEDYNSQIAVQRVRTGLQGILQKSSGFPIEKIIFVTGNDILHIDNPKRTTTSGTPQDTDGMWYTNFLMAKKLLIEVIETLLTIAPVEVVYNPSNHDYMSGFMLLQTIEAWFSKCSDVKFNNDMSHRKYTVYGKNLIGTTHMDGAKQNDLPQLMAHEASEYWHYCKHRYILGHHVHHKSSKDVFSVNIETLRSCSGTDSWHHKSGYQHAPKAVEAFIYHPENGQVARIMHLF